eukprot:gene11307-13153_t
MYDFAADVYAFGMLLFELITEIPPNKNFRYRNAHGGFALLESELRAAVKPGCPAALEALAYSCCETKALRRVVAPQIVEELDFILIELNRKPEEEVRPSPLRRASSTTNKYAHLLLPSPGSMKQLLPAKAAPAGAENVVSAPSVSGNSTSLPQIPAVVEVPTPAVAEKVESEGDAAALSVPVIEKVRKIHEAEQAPSTEESIAPSAGPVKTPQRRTALPLTPAPPINKPLSDSASADKSVKPPSPLPSVPSLNGPADVELRAEKEPKSTPTAPEDKTDAADAGPVIVNASKNKRRKGMFDASTAQVEDEVPPPQSAKSTSTEQVAAPPVVPDLQASGTAPIAENEAWLGSVSETVSEEVVKAGAEIIAPQAEVVEPSLSASSTTIASGSTVSSVPIEQTPDKKKKSRARAKIDYAVEGLTATVPTETAPPVTFVSATSEKIEVARPPAAASSSLSVTQEEKAEKIVGKADIVSVSFDLPTVAVAASTVPASCPPAAGSKSDNVNVPAAVAVSAPPAIPSSTPAILTASAMAAAPAVVVAQTVAPVSAPAAENVPQILPVESSTKTKATRSSSPKQAAPAPTPVQTAPSAPAPQAAAPAVPVLAEIASSQAEPFVQPSASVVHNSPPAVSGHLAPLDDTESRLFTVYAQPNFGSEYVTLNSFSLEMKPVEEPFVTAPAQIAPSIPAASMPVAVSSPAPPVLSQFALYSASAAPVHDKEHAPAASTKAVRAGGGRRESGAEAQPVPIPASIRALGEPEVIPAMPVKSTPSPAVVTPAVLEATSSEKSQERKSASNIVPETFKQHIRAFVETPERKKAVSAADNRDVLVSASNKDKTVREHSPVRLDPSPLVLSTPQADRTHLSNSFTDIFSPLSPAAAPASFTGAATVTPTPDGRVLSKKKSRSRNKLADKTLTPTNSFVLKSSPVVTVEPNVSSPVPPQNSSALASPQPLSVETTELFAFPAENDPDLKSPKPLNSNQKRRQNRAQARAAAAAFAAAATAAQEVVEGPQKEPASQSDLVQEEVSTEKASITGSMESAEEPAIVYTPKYAPPPVPVVAAPTSTDSGNNSDKKTESVQEKVSEEFHSPPRYSATHTPNSHHTATGLETPPSKAHHSPSRTPNGSLPVPAPHRHVHHFDLPAPQVTPPMHFPLSGAVSLVPLPTPPESPSIPLPHKQEPAEALQQVFSDADVKIATGSPQAKAGAQAQAQVYSTPHRTVEKLNRFNVLASADADSSHHKTLRMKVLSPAAASQKAVLSAPAPVVTVPVVNAYEERLLMMEQRLQALAEENLALQKELQVAVARPQVVPIALTPVLPAVVGSPAVPSEAQVVAEGEESAESDADTKSDNDAAGVMQERETIAEPAVPAPAPPRSNFGAMFRDFDETVAESVTSIPLAVQNSQISSTNSQQVSVPGRTSFTQELPGVPAVSSVAPPATPTGFVNALKNLEAIQTDLRSQLHALNAPPVVGAVNAVAEAEREKRSGEVEEDVEAITESSVDAAEEDLATDHVNTESEHDSSVVSGSVVATIPLEALPSTTAPQEVTPSTSTNAPSTVEAEQQLQAHIASAIDSKLGAVQAQIAQFSSLLNAILLAQSPQPQRAAQGDDASQLNSSSTHTSAFVTPNSIMTVNSTALGLETEEGGPGGSPSSSTLGPQKLFSQIDQQVEFQDLSPLAHSNSTDSGYSETHVLLRPSDSMQSSSVMPETGSFVPSSQVIWTTLDPTNPSVEPFSPTSDEGNISEDPPTEQEERDDDNYGQEQEEDIDGHEDIAPPAEVLEVITHKPTFASPSTAREVKNSPTSEEERNILSPGSPASPPANRPVSVSPAVNTSPATKSPSAKFLLEPLEEVIENPDVVATSNSSEKNKGESPGKSLSAIIPKIMLEEVPLEAWEVKARRASTTTAVELPIPKPVHEGETKHVPDTKHADVASVSVKEAAQVVSAPSPDKAEPVPPVVQDKIAPTEIVIPVTAPEPSSRVSTPRSRATSPFLRNRIPYPVEVQEGAALQFPHLFGEPQSEPAAEPVEAPEIKTEEKEPPVADVSSILPGDHAPFSPAREETQQVGVREPMKIPAPPAEEVQNSPTVSVGSRSTGESSSVVDTTDIEYPYSAEEYAQARHTPPQTLLNRSLTQLLPLPQTQGQASAAVQALHRHHEQQQRELLFQQEQQLQAELSAFGHQPHQQADHSSYLIPNAHHHNVHRSPATAFNSSTLSVQSALSTHSHHQHSPPPPPRLPSPHPSSPPAQGLASSMKFLDQINRLKDHYDAKDDVQLSQVPQRNSLDYTKSPPPAQVELRRPQAGQPHIEKHLHVSPSSSMERIGDGYQPQSLYPVSTAHAQRLNPRSTHGAFHALRASSPPPPLPRPLMHSDPYLAPHSYEAGNNSFRSPSPPRVQGTPQQQIHTQSTLTNSGGERARRHYEYAQQMSYPLPSSPPDEEWEEEEEEQMDPRNAQRLETLTGALNNFLSVIEKCTEISESADLAVSRLDNNMSRLDQRSHRKILSTAERGAEGSDRRSRSRERSDSLASTGKSASFAPQLSFYEPSPPPPSQPATLSRYNSFRNGSGRFNDDVYDAKYVDNYEDSDDDDKRTTLSRAGSMAARSRSNSNANVFDSTSSITREPVHT